MTPRRDTASPDRQAIMFLLARMLACLQYAHMMCVSTSVIELIDARVPQAQGTTVLRVLFSHDRSTDSIACHICMGALLSHDPCNTPSLRSMASPPLHNTDWEPETPKLWPTKRKPVPAHPGLLHWTPSACSCSPWPSPLDTACRLFELYVGPILVAIVLQL